MTTPTDPLEALAWHGGLTPTANGEQYAGRYADQGLYPRGEIEALLENGWAWRDHMRDHNQPVFPTRAGIEEARRRKPVETSHDDRLLAVVGSRRWEPSANQSPIAGLFITLNSGAELISGLKRVLELSQQPASAHLATLGGIVPDAIAAEVSGTPIAGSTALEYTEVPAATSTMLDIVRRYRVILDVRPKAGTATMFLAAAGGPRFLGGLQLPALVEAIWQSHSKLASAISVAELPDLLADLTLSEPGVLL